MLKEFDLHVIMMHYCKDQYTITGDSPYSLDMITMHSGEKPTEAQLNKWAAHYERYAPVKAYRNKLEKEDEKLQQDYITARRRRDANAMAEIEIASTSLYNRIKELNVAATPLDDYKRRKDINTLPVMTEEGEVLKEGKKGFFTKLLWG